MNFTSKNSVANPLILQIFLQIPSTNTKGELVMYAMKRMNNDMAVSPIVATLVLIVVAVIGAVAVGTIMGTFSSSVSKQANANGASTAAQSEIIVAGSTTINPITELAAAQYTALNPGVKITSQAMGSGAGVAAVGSGVADIGAASEVIQSKWTTQFPNLKSNLIGYGAVVMITNKATPGITAGDAISQDAADYIWDPTNTSEQSTGAGVADTALNLTTGWLPVYRADSSGTADTFFTNFVNMSAAYGGPTSSPNSNANNTKSLSVNGNAAMVSTVGSTAGAIGYADYGDSVANVLSGNPTVTILPVVVPGHATYTFRTFDGTVQKPGVGTTTNWNTLRSQAKYTYQTTVLSYPQSSVTDKYPAGLIRPLYYLTNGVPSAGVQSFISFVENQPVDTTNNINIFQETGNFCVADLG
jgi:phosphate transport system substrate-binding protein